MPDVTTWISALRSSHDRLAALLEPLDAQQVDADSYDDDWSIAKVASHLGSQAEIFDLALSAGLRGEPAPEMPAFQEIWSRWDATEPAEQVRRSVRVDADLVDRLEQLSVAEQDAFRSALFGSELDLAEFAGLRLGEHAVHTWDIAVALDPSATLADDAVELLVDTLPQKAARLGKPAEGGQTVPIRTGTPARQFTLGTSPEVTLTVGSDGSQTPLTLPAEALIRLFFGRLDPAHTPSEAADDPRLDPLRAVFPGP